MRHLKMHKTIKERARASESVQTICQMDLGAEKVSPPRSKQENVFFFYILLSLGQTSSYSVTWKLT